MVLCRREGANTDVASKIRVETACRKGKNSGLSSVVTELVSLEVLSWNVAGLSEDSTDVFLS